MTRALHAGALPVPNSAARRRPALDAPAGACDAHIHIYEGDIATGDYAVENADVAAYRKLQAVLGTSRAVIVQPRVYGTDNSVTLRAIKMLGLEHARGVAVVAPDIAERDLQALHEGGIRGIRFSLHAPNAGAGDFPVVERLAHKAASLGWHLQLHWTADQIAQQRSMLERLPVQLVFDHLGRLPLADPCAHPAYSVIADLLQAERAWVKLSGPYLDSVAGAGGSYRDTDTLAQRWLAIAPQRAVWGSDWPHVTEPEHKPDDAELFDLLGRWCADDGIRRQVLVDNPARLYGFDS